MTTSQLDITNKCQDVSSFPAGDHNASINIRAQKHNKKLDRNNIYDPQKKHRLRTVSKNILLVVLSPKANNRYLNVAYDKVNGLFFKFCKCHNGDHQRPLQDVHTHSIITAINASTYKKYASLGQI